MCGIFFVEMNTGSEWDWNTLELPCVCGRRHVSHTQILTADDVEDISQWVKPLLQGGTIGIVTDQPSAAFAAEAADRLQREGYRTVTVTYPQDVPLEQDSLQDLHVQPECIRIWIAIGGRSVCMLTQWTATERAQAWIAMPTVPFGMEYLQPQAVLTHAGIRHVRAARMPDRAILVSEWLHAACPQDIAAGFGSLIARGVDLTEMRMRAVLQPDKFCSRAIQREYAIWQDTVAKVMQDADPALSLAYAHARCGLAMQAAGSSADCACDVLADVADATVAASMPFGVRRMLAAVGQIGIGHILLAAESTGGIPRDRTEACVRLARACGGESAHYVIATAQETALPQSVFVLREYRRDFCEWWGQLRGAVREWCKVFRRSFADAGYCLSGYMTFDTLWNWLQDGAVLCHPYSLLRLIDLL